MKHDDFLPPFTRLVATSSIVVVLSLALACCATSGTGQALIPNGANSGVLGTTTGASQTHGVRVLSAYPETFVGTISDGQRFRDPDYFKMLAADGILKVDAQALYARLQAAVAANERYKALYFARLFTNAKPEVAAGWSNRASIATVLGLTNEAGAALQNANNPAHSVPVPLGLLPGPNFTTRPVSLGDWAAAMALISDGIAAKEGPNALLAIRDSVSGIHKATARELAEEAAQAREDGQPSDGPWARPESIKLQDVLPNAFSLRAGEPMKYQSTNTVGMTFAILAAGLSGLQMNTNALAADQSLKAANLLAGQASDVPSNYKGGNFTTAIYKDDKDAVTVNHPQPSGKYYVVGLPVPLLWASGGSLTPAIGAQWKSTEKTFTTRIAAGSLRGRKGEIRLADTLLFPKLLTLCDAYVNRERCSRPLTLMELMLTNKDMEVMAPTLASRFVEQGFLEHAYLRDNLLLSSVNSDAYNDKDSRTLAGYDKDGVVYCPTIDKSGINATAWLVPAR